MFENLIFLPHKVLPYWRLRILTKHYICLLSVPYLYSSYISCKNNVAFPFCPFTYWWEFEENPSVKEMNKKLVCLRALCVVGRSKVTQSDPMCREAVSMVSTHDTEVSMGRTLLLSQVFAFKSWDKSWMQKWVILTLKCRQNLRNLFLLLLRRRLVFFGKHHNLSVSVIYWNNSFFVWHTYCLLINRSQYVFLATSTSSCCGCFCQNHIYC